MKKIGKVLAIGLILLAGLIVGVYTAINVNAEDLAEVYPQTYSIESNIQNLPEAQEPEPTPEVTPSPTPDVSQVYVRVWLDKERDVYRIGEPVTVLSEVIGYTGPTLYQWFIKSSNEDEWKMVEGATESTMIVILNKESVNYSYRVRVTIDTNYL